MAAENNERQAPPRGIPPGFQLRQVPLGVVGSDAASANGDLAYSEGSAFSTNKRNPDKRKKA